MGEYERRTMGAAGLGNQQQARVDWSQQAQPQQPSVWDKQFEGHTLQADLEALGLAALPATEDELAEAWRAVVKAKAGVAGVDMDALKQARNRMREAIKHSPRRDAGGTTPAGAEDWALKTLGLVGEPGDAKSVLAAFRARVENLHNEPGVDLHQIERAKEELLRRLVNVNPAAGSACKLCNGSGRIAVGFGGVCPSCKGTGQSR